MGLGLGLGLDCQGGAPDNPNHKPNPNPNPNRNEVGVNMPARSVTFSQLDKPNDGDLPGHRPLRPDEFWQMAGRAGRRGMDELGYVLYAPTLSVAGLRNLCSADNLRGMPHP